MVLTPTLELCEPEVRSGIEFSASFTPTLVFHSFWVLSNLADCNYGDASMHPIGFFSRGMRVFVLRILLKLP